VAARANPAGQLGANLRRALALAEQIEGRKKRRTLAEIGAALDRGQPDPSIRELARRAELRPVVVASIVDGLEKAGLLEVERGGAETRNRYRLPAGPRPTT
jgi:DNA-binding MarR family transcriptional regulator